MNIYKQLEFINKLPSKDTAIFDVGCGDGRVSKPFYEAGYKVIGIDTNSNKIAEAQALMPNGTFEVSSIEDISIPSGKVYFIAKNSIPFLSSKDKINAFLEKISGLSGYFSLFGEKDEMVEAGKAVSYSRAEVDSIMQKRADVILFIETIGEGVNLAGNPRKSHKFEIYTHITT